MNVNFKQMVAASLISIVMASCGTNNVQYTVLEHYFVNNDVTNPVPVCITSQSELEKYFGMAPVMGADGLPTAVDFTKSVVVSITQPETDIQTEIKLTDVEEINGKLVVSYKIVRGDKIGYTMRPLLLFKVDRKYSGAVTLKEVD